MENDRQNTLPENTDFSSSFQEGFYLLTTASHPMAITVDYKYIFYLQPVDGIYEPVSDTIEKADIDIKNIDIGIMEWQLAGYLPTLKWTNSDPNFIPRPFQKKLMNGDDIKWFLSSIESLEKTKEYKQAVDFIMRQG